MATVAQVSEMDFGGYIIRGSDTANVIAIRGVATPGGTNFCTLREPFNAAGYQTTGGGVMFLGWTGTRGGTDAHDISIDIYQTDSDVGLSAAGNGTSPVAWQNNSFTVGGTTNRSGAGMIRPLWGNNSKITATGKYITLAIGGGAGLTQVIIWVLPL